MSRHHQQGGEPSQRMLRVGELIRHALSDILSRGSVVDPALDGHVISVPDVKMSPDLKLATAYVMPLGGNNAGAVVDALERNRKFLRGEIAHRVTMKFSPDLRFKLDTSFEYGAKIDALLDSPDVKRDIVGMRDVDGLQEVDSLQDTHGQGTHGPDTHGARDEDA